MFTWCLDRLVTVTKGENATDESKAHYLPALKSALEGCKDLWPVVWRKCYETSKHAARVRLACKDVPRYVVRFARAYKAF